MKSTDDPIVVEQTYGVTTDRLWSAITEIDQMRRWFFENIPSFEPKVGFETRFNVQSGAREFLHVWHIVKVNPRKLISYDWRYAGLPGILLVSFELYDEGQLSRLRLIATVLEDFPQDIPEFTREACLGGWRYFIQESLQSYLEQQE